MNGSDVRGYVLDVPPVHTRSTEQVNFSWYREWMIFRFQPGGIRDAAPLSKMSIEKRFA